MAENRRVNKTSSSMAIGAGIEATIDLPGDFIATLTEAGALVEAGDATGAAGMIERRGFELTEAFHLHRAILILHRRR